MQKKIGVTRLVCEIKWIKCSFLTILKRYCYHSNRWNTLPLTLFDALKAILCISLVSFFFEIFMSTFWGWNLPFSHFSRNSREPGCASLTACLARYTYVSSSTALHHATRSSPSFIGSATLVNYGIETLCKYDSLNLNFSQGFSPVS